MPLRLREQTDLNDKLHLGRILNSSQRRWCFRLNIKREKNHRVQVEGTTHGIRCPITPATPEEHLWSLSSVLGHGSLFYSAPLHTHSNPGKYRCSDVYLTEEEMKAQKDRESDCRPHSLTLAGRGVTSEPRFFVLCYAYEQHICGEEWLVGEGTAVEEWGQCSWWGRLKLDGEQLACPPKECDVILSARGGRHKCCRQSSEHRVSTPAGAQAHPWGSGKKMKIPLFCSKRKKLNFINNWLRIILGYNL